MCERTFKIGKAALVSVLTVHLHLHIVGVHGARPRTDSLSIYDGGDGFSNNLAGSLLTNDSITGAVGTAVDLSGDVYVTGNIEATGTGEKEQSFAKDEIEDRLGGQDVFVLKLAFNRTLIWSKRLGSPGTDLAHAIAVDGEGQVYVTATTGRNSVNVKAGPIVVKYDNNGTRIWMRNYGSKLAGDKLSAIATNQNSSEVIITGAIGAQSPLHTNATKREVDAVVILRLGSREGDIRGLAVADSFNNSVGAIGNALAVKIENGTGKCYVAGTSIIQSGGSRIQNAAIYSFTYPDLERLSKTQILSQIDEIFVGVATSKNPYSVYAVGMADVSIYSELDGKVARFNSSNLALGWNKTIETITFPDQASISTGLASEAARGVAVDEFGNVYVILEAGSALTDANEQARLKNKRPAIKMYAPNGTEMFTFQSNISVSTGVEAIQVYNRTALVSGWTLDSETRVAKLYLSTLKIPADLYLNNSSEYEPPSANLEGGPSANQPDEDSSPKIGLIAGATGGAVGLLVVVAIVVALFMRGRSGS